MCIRDRYSMPHGIVLFTERNPVLIIISTILYHATNIDQILRKFKIAGITYPSSRFLEIDGTPKEQEHIIYTYGKSVPSG